jgi:hypothetical protein
MAFGFSGMPEEIEECRRHYDMIEQECHEIKGAINADVRKVFQRVSEALSDDLDFVRKQEQRINVENAK